MLRGRTIYLFLLLLTGARVQAPGAANVPPGFSVKQVAAGLRSPTAMAISPDDRLFICEQGGSVRIVRNDVLVVRPFLSISVDSSGERRSEEHTSELQS